MRNGDADNPLFIADALAIAIMAALMIAPVVILVWSVMGLWS
jgi:hypothetical protein